MALPSTKSTPRQQREQSAIRAPRVLYIGDREAIDFQPARRRLAAESARGMCSLTDAGDLAAAIGALDRQRPDQRGLTDVIVLAQLRPGELNAVEVNELRRRAPLAAMVALCGAWCEGEGRSGHPLPGISQVAWHQFPPRWVRHRFERQQGRPTLWSLPATWREEERLLYQHPIKEPNTSTLFKATIVLSDSGCRDDDWLASLALAQGWQVAFASQSATPRQFPPVGVWSTDELDRARLNELAGFVSCLKSIPVIAITGFPRPEDDLRIREAGAHGLLAKPLVVEDLVAEIGWVLGDAGQMQEK